MFSACERRKSRNLTLEEKIVNFKTIPLSKIIFQALIITHPNHISKELKNM